MFGAFTSVHTNLMPKQLYETPAALKEQESFEDYMATGHVITDGRDKRKWDGFSWL